MLAHFTKQFKRTLIGFEVLFFILMVLIAYNFFLPLGKENKTLYFPNNTPETITRTLKDHGFNITEWDKYLLSTVKLPSSGWYDISHLHGGRYHFFKHLKDTPSQTLKLKVFAGETSCELVNRLAKDLKLDEEKLLEVYSNKSRFQEADIFAKTYTVARNADENTTLAYLFDRSRQILENFKKEHFIKEADFNTVKILLTIASIIQKETNNPKEMPLISSVIYNRLKKGMKLQMDGTLNYGKFSHCIVTPERIKSDNTFYNTYKYKGLPPAPINLPEISSIDAVLNYEKHQYIYMCAKEDFSGYHYFAKTNAQHERYAAKYHAALNKLKVYK